MTSDSDRFARLGAPKRVWAIGAIHADVTRLAALHDHIARRFEPGERIVYLGNLIGRQPAIAETIDELLTFRRSILAVPGALAGDVVFLRGAQEEMWQKLLQLQFAPNPAEVLRWMLTQGVEPTLAAYGGRPDEGLAAAREGAVQLTRWTNRLRDAMRAAPGHLSLFAALKRAAYCGPPGLLLISAGIDVTRPLGAQGDSFWWGGAAFASIDQPYGEFTRIVRGYDAANGGVAVGELTVTLDGGCGRGGGLAAGLFAADGEAIELFEV